MPKFRFPARVRQGLIDGLTDKLLTVHDDFVLSRSVQKLIGEGESQDIYESMNAMGPEVAQKLEQAVKKIIPIWEWILSDDPPGGGR